MRLVIPILLLFSELALATPPSNAELGAKDPDLYDIMDWYRVYQLEKKKREI